MRRIKPASAFLTIVVLLSAVSGGCGSLSKPAPKLETSGPLGKTTPHSKNTFLESLSSAPSEIYDLEEAAGILFSAIINQDWLQAQQTLVVIKDSWQKAHPAVRDKKDLEEGDIILDNLSSAVTTGKITESCENLSKFMTGASKISKTYQLSPLSDIISIANAIREVAFYVKDENWEKAAAKSKEMENIWNQNKSTMEQIGILGEITKTHSLINQMKDAVDAENKDMFFEYSSDLNKSLGKIRDFFYGK